jgi:hypothetical protein
LFLSQKAKSDLADVCPDLFSTEVSFASIEELQYIVNEWVTMDNINDFQSSPMAIPLQSFVRAFYEKRATETWATIITKLIKMGASIHRCSSTCTLLDALFSGVDQPFESKVLGETWLSILRLAGIDVNSYIETECRLRHRDSPLMLVDEYLGNRQLFFSLQEPQSVSWDWWTDPEVTAFLVVEEFKYIANTALNTWHCDWSHGNWSYLWPYRMYHWQYCDQYDWLEDERNSLEKIYQPRFERRRQKKAAKFARIQGFRKTTRIPGAWID